MEATTAIASAGVFIALVSGGVSLFNSWKSVRWKRAEFANNFMKDFNANPELVFAGRCLDWNGGRLLLPDSLRAYLPDNAAFIEHDRRVFALALRPDLPLLSMDSDPRIQIYRTSIDTFLTWLTLVASALDRKLFMVEDIQEAGYWVAKIQSEVVLHGFISGYGYQENIESSSVTFGEENRLIETGFSPPIHSPCDAAPQADREVILVSKNKIATRDNIDCHRRNQSDCSRHAFR